MPFPITPARVAAVAIAAPIAYSLIEPYRLLLKRFDVVMRDLPPAVEGLRIAQLSDLHCSAITPPALVRRAVEICNTQQPDIIVLTGDYVSRRNSYAHVTLARIWAKPVMEYAAAMAQEVSNLKAQMGVFAVPGNHDHSRGHFDAIESLMQQAGITTLVNRSTLVRDALPLIGLDDLRGGRPEVRTAFDGIAPEQAQIVLSHNPRMVWSMATRNCLLITGHTHGGQVHLPFTNFRRRPRDMRGTEWHQGWYELEQARMYVSSGVGSVHFPMRFRCPPEVAVFTLRSGDY